MLVLSRKRGQKLVIGNEIIVSVLEVSGNRVKVGLEAPAEHRIVRAEIRDRTSEKSSSLPSGDKRA